MKKMVVLLILFLIPMKTMALETSATASILMDTDNNRILYANNIHKVRSIASISKIMTAIVAIESGKLDETVTVGDEIKKAYGSGIYIQIGENIKLLDLTCFILCLFSNLFIMFVIPRCASKWSDSNHEEYLPVL